MIEVHRLMKNSIQSNQYVLLTEALNKEIGLASNYQSKLFKLELGFDSYDGKEIKYAYLIIDKKNLKLKPFERALKFNFERAPDVRVEKDFQVSANELLEVISNFSYRTKWVDEAEGFLFNPNEVNRLGTEHVCIVNGKHIDFTTITKDVKPMQLVYGELTKTPKPIDAAYQYYIITPLEKNTCRLEMEAYIEAKSIFKKILFHFVVKKAFQKNVEKAVDNLYKFVLNKSI